MKIAVMDARSAIILLKFVQIVVKVTGWIPLIIYVRLNVKEVFLPLQTILPTQHQLTKLGSLGINAKNAHKDVSIAKMKLWNASMKL